MTAHDRASKKEPRTYTLRRRAEQQAQTRRRIVEAAVELHGTIGPARTTFSMIAERAGVQRHTLYAHFPDEKALSLACSGLAFERDPPPDPQAWRSIADARSRLSEGLAAIYAWYARNAELNACVIRDAEVHAPTREIMELRFGPVMASYLAALGDGLTPPQAAMLRLALSFHTWRTLAQEARLSPDAAVRAMVAAIFVA